MKHFILSLPLPIIGTLLYGVMFYLFISAPLVMFTLLLTTFLLSVGIYKLMKAWESARVD